MVNVTRLLLATALRYKKALITLGCLALYWVSSYAVAAQLTASVDKNHLSLDASLTLTLTFNEQLQNGEYPDLSPLEQDFSVVNSQQNNRVSIVNGQRSATTQWNIILVPKQSGELRIPPITLAGSQSQAITITVNENDNAANSQPKTVYFDTSIDTKNTYVQAQIIYTRKLFYSIALEGNLPELDIPGAVSERIGDAKTYETMVKGVRYNVNETRYAIYPQNSGSLTIPAQVFQGYTRGRSIWDNRQPVIARTQAHTINVKPKPANYPAHAAWLPAKSLSAIEEWSDAPSKVVQGEPVTRTITLRAEGLSAAQLPPISLPEQPELKIYPDQSDTHDEVTNTGVIGIREENFAIMPIKSGNITLPEIKITWWNTTLDKLEETTIPRAELNVTASSQPGYITQPPTANTQSLSTAVNDASNPSTDTAQPAASQQEKTQQTSPFWIALSVLLLISNLCTAAVWWYHSRYKTQKTAPQPHTKTATNQSEAKAFKHLQQSLNDTDLLRAKQSILQWGQAYWQNENISQLSQVINNMNDSACKNNLKALNNALYASNTSKWSSEDCKALLSSYRQTFKSQQTTTQTSLPKLYPSS